MRKKLTVLVSATLSVSLLSACGTGSNEVKQQSFKKEEVTKTANHTVHWDVIPTHKDLNQKPVPLKIEE
jgi:nitrite reductase (NO-forming)